MSLKVYSADEVAVVFAAILLESESADTFVSIVKLSDSFTYLEGVNGHGTRSRRRGRGYRVTVSLPQSSEKNILLSAIYNLDILPDTNGSGVAPFSVVDTGGTSVFIAPESWIVKIPDWTAAAEADNVDWVFDCHDGIQNVGGN